MARSRNSDEGWDIPAAISLLRATMDPYLWEQGQELYVRGAVEDFAIQASGDIQVRVLDPRDARTFFVGIDKDSSGRIRIVCRCPYQLGGHCRHQVVALKYLEAVGQGEADPSDLGVESSEGGEATIDEGAAAGMAPVLYRLFDTDGVVSTQADGSLLRVVVQAFGSSRTPHRAGLQLFTGTGWTALRTADVDRWIGRGAKGAHPRDTALARFFLDDGVLRTEIDSETLSAVLSVVAGSEAIVDRSGTGLVVSRTPCSVFARVVAGEEHAIGVELGCRTPEDEEVRFDEVLLVPAVAPWIQLENGALHPLICGTGGAILEELQEEDLSSIPPGSLDRFLSDGVATLERLCPGNVETDEGLIADVEGVRAARIRLDGEPCRLEGLLEFRYGDEWVEAPQTPEPWTVERDGKVVRYPPAGQSMARAHRELEGLGFYREAGVWILEGPQTLARLLAPRPRRFVEFEPPSKLRTLDLVQRQPSLSLSVHGSPAWSARFGAGEGAEQRGAGDAPTTPRADRFGIDWFDVEFRLLDGTRELEVDLDSLCAAVIDSPDGVLQLDDGTVLGLGHDAVTTLAGLATRGSGADSASGGRGFRVGLPVLAELVDEDSPCAVDFDEEIRDLADALRRGKELPVAPLEESFEKQLRSYQKEAVQWFGGLARFGVGGILADEMGLGKTVMALGHLFGRRTEEGSSTRPPVLVVCPTSLIFNWVDECRRFCSGVDVVGVAGLPAADRQELILGRHDLIVTSYALLRRDREVLESREFRAVLLDEGQHIKNASSQTAKAAFALRSDERWILTGTPLENHLGELWSLFQFLLPGYLGSAKEFKESLAEPIRRGDEEARALLRSRLRPFLLRRTKDQVLTELPECIEQIERVQMSREQEELYAKYRARARSQIDADGGEKSRFQVLAALTRLRQICCDPRLIEDERDTAGPSTKLDLLFELLQECIDEDHRVLLFSQFTGMLDLIQARLEEQGVRHCRLDGSTRDREGEVRRFTRDEGIPLFLISLKAGGHGLNLTQADTVILYDPWWNPAVEAQAAARAHRLGQEVPVHVHKLVVAGTVEEKILELQEQKRDLAAGILESEDDFVAQLDFKTLQSLLQEF